MRIKFCVKESIRARRIVPENLSVSQRVNSLFFLFLSLIFLGVGVITVTLFVKTIRSGNLSIPAWLFSLLIFLLCAAILYSLLRDNRLTTIRGKGKADNKRIITSILKEVYQTDLLYESDELITYYRRATLLKFAVRVIVLFDGNDVLINISRFNQLDIKSPFHEPLSQLKIKSIKEKFDAIIASSQFR
jgi:hypothetical protein